MIHNSRLFSFVLVSKVRSCVHIIKLPNPRSKLIILKIIILIDSEIEVLKPSKKLFYGYPLSLRECCL
jgi:hypothetical protein